MNTRELEERIKKLEKQLDRFNDMHEIQMLMGKYATNHNQKNMHKTPQFYAFSQPDVSVEIGDRGVFVGEKSIRMLYEQLFQVKNLEGNMLIHFLTNPMIEVAQDGKTAKGLWWSPGIEAVVLKEGEKPQAIWSFCKYPIDFYKENGVWKFWHYRVYRVAKCSYEKGWVEDQSWAFTGKLPNSPETQPITYHNPYTPTSIQEAIPACPEPYDTWKDSSWIFANEPQYMKK